jgi:uncharacterized repeat protein (TIGR03803 family)
MHQLAHYPAIPQPNWPVPFVLKFSYALEAQKGFPMFTPPARPSSIKTALLAVIGIMVTLFALVNLASSQAQEKVLYAFCSAPNCADGATPQGDLVFDKQGNIYGTTHGGGACGQGYGTVFELSPLPGGGWTEAVLHSFGASTNCQNAPDGADPSGLILDSKGNLYGVTFSQGPNGHGTVFELTPPSVQGGDWTETVLWGFNYHDGSEPQSRLIFDASGNLYSTTTAGGTLDMGTVFQLVPPATGTQWSLNTLYNFGTNSMDGSQPYAGVVFDKAGNLYGTTLFGGKGIGYHQQGWGIVYKLTPGSQLPWSESILYWFTPKTGVNPQSELAIDAAGNLYGAVPEKGLTGDGAVFRLAPQAGGAYQFNELLFTGSPNGAGPETILLQGKMFYGTTGLGGVDQYAGTVFEINGTTESVLYSFCSLPNCADGGGPYGPLTVHGSSLFGVGTLNPYGDVFELSPP